MESSEGLEAVSETLQEEMERLRTELLAERSRCHRLQQEVDSAGFKRKRAVENLLKELKKVYAERRRAKHARKVVTKLMRAAGVSCDTDLDSDPIVSAVKRLLRQRDEERAKPWWSKLLGS